MRTILLTEAEENHRLELMRESLSSVLCATDTEVLDLSDRNYRKYRLEIPDPYYDFLMAELKEKIAELIVIGYKYDFFSENLRTAGLSEENRELFLTAIIAADLADDRRYAVRKITLGEEISVDGLYHFRMQKLLAKWQEILSALPEYLSEDLYRSFMLYLIEDFPEKPVYVVDGKVFDEHYNRRTNARLLGESTVDGTVREILLCAGKEVHLLGKVSEKVEEFLREFYGRNVVFHPREKTDAVLGKNYENF